MMTVNSVPPKKMMVVIDGLITRHWLSNLSRWIDGGRKGQANLIRSRRSAAAEKRVYVWEALKSPMPLWREIHTMSREFYIVAIC